MNLDWELFSECQSALGPRGMHECLGEVFEALNAHGVAPDTLQRLRIAVLRHFEGDARPGLRIFVPRHWRSSNKPPGAWSFFLVVQGKSPLKQLELYLYV